MKTERLNLAAILGFAAILTLVVTGTKIFTLNGQAWDMWAGFGNHPIEALLSGHPHGLRYLAYYPVFSLANLSHVPPDMVFSLLCAVLLLLIAVYVRRVSVELWGSAGRLHDAVTIAIFALSLLMNGRLILAFLGYLFVIFVGVDWLKRRSWRPAHVAYLVAALVLAGVSSGTLFVAMALVAGIGGVTLLRAPSLVVGKPQMAVSLIVVLALFAAPTAIGVRKNLDYYGGDGEAAIRMLNHGAAGGVVDSLGGELPTLPGVDEDDARPSGAIGEIVQFWWAGVLAAGVVAWFMGWRPVRMIKEAEPQENVVHLSLVFTMLGGLFAYSVLSMSIVPLLVLGTRYAPAVARRMNIYS